MEDLNLFIKELTKHIKTNNSILRHFVLSNIAQKLSLLKTIIFRKNTE